MTTRQSRELIDEAVRHWNEDKAPRLAAALSFYAVLALAPFLVVAVAVASFVLDKESVQNAVVREVTLSMGRHTAGFVSDLIEKSAQPATGAVAALASISVAFFGASSLFLQLSDTVNHIWGVPLQPTSIKAFLRTRFLSLLMLLAFGLVFMGWLALDSWLGWIGRRTIEFPWWQWVSQLASVAFLTLVFAGSFRALPRNCVAWKDVWFGAAIAAAGFTVSKYLLSLYFAYSGVSAAYGSAGALVVILLWVYYTTQIYFFGLELVYTYAHRFGSQAKRPPGGPPIRQGRSAAVD